MSNINLLEVNFYLKQSIRIAKYTEKYESYSDTLTILFKELSEHIGFKGLNYIIYLLTIIGNYLYIL